MMTWVAVLALLMMVLERAYARAHPPKPSRRPGEMLDQSAERLRAQLHPKPHP